MKASKSAVDLSQADGNTESKRTEAPMKLSDNEIRDITKLLEAGKPLPDRYRFVLFGDEREIELVWNGKSADVTNVVLPFQTIEHVDEPRPEEDIALQPDLLI